MFLIIFLKWCGSLVMTKMSVLGLRMQGWPRAMEGSCDYIEKATADSRQGMILEIGDGAWV
jgi:hypothetical protein